MTVKKMVDGVLVDLTPEELAEYEANLANPPAPPMPQLSMRQFRLGLLNAGILAQVQAAIDGMSEPARSAAQIEFEYATVVLRDNPLVATLAAALGLTDAQIDAMWLDAATL